MTKVARDAGLSRESLYKTRSGERSPEFDTILKVTRALGIQLHAGITTKTETRTKILVPLTFASLLFVSACANPPQDNAGIQSPVVAPPTSSVHNYRCESGETISATYLPPDSATVRYKGGHYDMKIAVSGSGSRYVGGELEWWTKGSGPGSEGALFRHMTDGTSGELIELCTEF